MTYKPEPYVLFADDDPDDQEIFMEIIGRLRSSVQVHVFDNGLSLLKYLEMFKNIAFPDFIVLDINMPIWDGYQTLVALRNIARYNSIPIIMCSTSSSTYDRKRCLEAGADEYICKPGTNQEFDMVVRKLSIYLF